MKIIIIGLISLIINTSYGQTDLKKENLKGHVRSTKTTSYRSVIVAGEVVDMVRETDAFEGDDKDIYYNLKGFKNEEIIYDEKNNFKEKYLYLYYKDEKKIERYLCDINNTKIRISLFEGINNSQILKRFIFANDNTLSLKIIISYNPLGNKTEEKWYNSDGNVLVRWIYKYDEHNNQVEMSKYTPEGNLHAHWTYTYDNKGSVISKDDYSVNYNIHIITKYKYTYDSENNWTTKIVFNQDNDYIISRKIEYY